MLIRGAEVVTMNEGREVLPSADVLVVGDRIAKVGIVSAADAAGHEVLEARGKTLIPGLIQTHIHLCQTLFRNQADDLALLDWLKQRIWPFEAAHTPESLRASADLGIAELLRGGTTSILDMATVRHTDAVFEAARDAGIRATIGKCHMDLDGGQPAPLRETTRESLAEARAVADRWHEAEGGRLRYAYAPRFALSCTDALLREVGGLARERGLLVHTHASENRDECAIVRDRCGADNIAYLLGLGIDAARLCLAHCVWATDEELDLMARGGVKVLHCPGSNLKLASGIARVPEMLDRGICVSIGADGAPCNNNLSAFQEMRLAALLQKPRLGPRVMPAERVFELATLEGARALGLEDRIGRIEVGMLADLALLDLGRGAATVPAGEDVYARIVYSAGASDVTDVLVGGRPVVRGGRLLTVDEPTLLGERAPRELARLKERMGGQS
ncbi:MAG TPA: 5'-deoxyadenosine deaminase [Planctomycetota bacterium]|nr:5'-deoxyadenosine deaminase [Planctomycetota bacterium]